MDSLSTRATLGPEERFLAHLGAGGRLSSICADRIRRVQLESIERLAPVLLKLGVLAEDDLAAEMASFGGFERLPENTAPEAIQLSRR